MTQEYSELLDLERSGVLHVPGFLSPDELTNVHAEADTLPWHDNHSSFINARGLTIVQNHDVYALKLSQGDQRPLDSIPRIAAAGQKVTQLISEMSESIPTLKGWAPDEMSMHRYDDAEVGLSFHRDNRCFIGLIAIVSIDGSCDLAVKRGEAVTLHPAEPGDIMLLRAPGLVETDQEVRPEHAVINLRTPTRTSLMLRANNQPQRRINGFHFQNW